MRSGALGFPGALYPTANTALKEAGLLSCALLKLALVLAGCPNDLGVFHMALPCMSKELTEVGFRDQRHRNWLAQTQAGDSFVGGRGLLGKE